MKTTIFFLVFTIFFQISAENMWITQHASEGGMASGSLIHIGTKTKGYALGTVDNGQGGKTPYCFVMTDGMNWNECSSNLTGKTKLVAPARVLPNGKLVGVIIEMKGFNTLSSFIVSDDMENFIPVSFFDPENSDENTSRYGEALSVIGETVWLGLRNGKIKKSTDLGATWENIVVSTDTTMEMSVVKFSDELNGIAAGGVVTESMGDNGTEYSIVKKGAIFRTADGGNTWTPIVENLEMFPENVIETSTGRIYLQFYDDDSMNNPSTGQKSIVWSEDNFATFTGKNKSFDIPVPSGNFSMGSVFDMDDGAVNEIWITGFCGAGFNVKPCTIDTADGGQTWFEKLLIGAGKLGPISVLDSDHVYTAAMSKAIYKWGDINEDFTETEVPDESETSDDTVEIPDENQTVDDAQTVDENTTNDTETGSDDEQIVDEEEAGCGCSLIY